MNDARDPEVAAIASKLAMSKARSEQLTARVFKVEMKPLPIKGKVPCVEG